MKRIITAILIFFISSTIAFADGEPFANAGEIYQHWYEAAGERVRSGELTEDALIAPYPDYVTGVWSTDGSGENLTFAIIKGYEDLARAEILDLVADKNSVTFAEGGKYTMAQLREVQNYIGSKMSEGAGSYPIWGCGIQDDKNVVVCSININNENAQSVKDELNEKYGDMIIFEESTAMAVTETALPTDIPAAEEEIAQYAAGEESAAEESGLRQELPLERLPVSDIIAYILIGIGATAIIASIIILKKKKTELKK